MKIATFFTHLDTRFILKWPQTFPKLPIVMRLPCGSTLIHLDVKLTEFLDVGARFLLVMEAVVGIRQPFLSGKPF